MNSTGVPAAAADTVWATSQQSPAMQRRGRYLPESVAHPAKMLPAVAAHAIAAYTRPGDLVLDPMCGIGTTLVEALHQERRAVGVEYETRWAELARANIELTGPVPRGQGRVYTGDARHLDWVLPRDLIGQVALVVTSPPYGPSTHGHVTTNRSGVHKRNHLYGDLLDRGNLANIGHHRLLADARTGVLTIWMSMAANTASKAAVMVRGGRTAAKVLISDVTRFSAPTGSLVFRRFC
jgi:tRNA G10  N-methylase Trm11